MTLSRPHCLFTFCLLLLFSQVDGFSQPVKTLSLRPTSTSNLEFNNAPTLFSSSTAGDFTLDNTSNKPNFLVVLWRFTRPHTLIGSALAVPSLHFIAAPTSMALPTLFAMPSLYKSILYASLPALLMNLYITGLNQITDVEIDRINKPNLPIPAGHLSIKAATIIVVTSLLGSLYLGSIASEFATPGLRTALWLSGILGTLYSLPPFRLKRFHLLAAFCIVAVRGAVINASFYAHALTAAFGGAAASSAGFLPSIQNVLNCIATQPRCLYSSLFFGVFGVVIALMKDVPDVLGDKLSNINTFSVRLGANQVFHTMRRLLSGLFVCCGLAFAGGSVTAGMSAFNSNNVIDASASFVMRRLCIGRAISAVSAFWAGWSVKKQAQEVDPRNSGQVYKYYMHLWKLFYLSYFILPFAR